MVSLELFLDASGMQRGADQAKTALDGVTAKAKAAETATANMGRGLNAAFQATGGSIQVAQGISQTAKAIGDLNVAAAGLSASRSLLEVGRIGQDLAGLSGRFGALGTAMARLNPYLIAGSLAMSAISLAMQLFGENASKAAVGIRELAAAQSDLNAQEGLARRYNDAQLLERARQAKAESLTRFASEVYSQPGSYTVSVPEFSAAAGISEEETRRRRLERLGPADRNGLTTPFGQPLDTVTRSPITRNAALDILEALRAEALKPPQYVNRPTPSGGFFADGARNYVEPTDAERLNVSNDDFRKAQELTAMMVDDARRFGEYMGDGIADVVLGLGSARQVLAAMLQDIARMGIRSATGSLFGAAANAFGSTAAQTAAPSTGLGGTPGQAPYYIAAP